MSQIALSIAGNVALAQDLMSLREAQGFNGSSNNSELNSVMNCPTDIGMHFNVHGHLDHLPGQLDKNTREDLTDILRDGIDRVLEMQRQITSDSRLADLDDNFSDSNYRPLKINTHDRGRINPNDDQDLDETFWSLAVGLIEDKE